MTSDPSSQELSPIKRALLEIRELRAQVETLEQAQNEPVAIIGAGLRFPGGAHDAETFWQILRDGVDTVTEIPPERWDIEQFYDPDPAKPGKMTTRYGTFLRDIDRFDAAFFGISPREAPAWTRSSASCSRPPGKRWKMPGWRRNGCSTHRPACSSASPITITFAWSCAIWRKSTPTPARAAR